MAVCDIVRIRKRVLELLIASPKANRYTDAIGTNAEYAVLQEITDTILQIDCAVCVDIISTIGHPFRASFMFPSGALSSGDFVPSHVGVHGDVRITVSAVAQPGMRANARDDVLRMIEFPTRYLSRRFYWIEDSVLYHAGDSASVYTPVLNKSVVCQAHESYEDIEVYGTVGAVEKIGNESQFFSSYRNLYQFGRGLIRGKAEVIPPQQELEQMMRRAA